MDGSGRVHRYQSWPLMVARIHKGSRIRYDNVNGTESSSWYRSGRDGNFVNAAEDLPFISSYFEIGCPLSVEPTTENCQSKFSSASLFQCLPALYW